MRAQLWNLLCVIILLAAATEAQAQAGTTTIMRTRGTGGVLRATAAPNTCVQNTLEVRALESAQRVQPGGSNTERREVFINYFVTDRCTRLSLAFQIEASAAAQLSVRRQLDRGELSLDAASINVRRCQARGTAVVCQLVQLPVKLQVTWRYNGLYDLHVGTSSSRDNQGFRVDAINEVRHVADVTYRFELEGSVISFDKVEGSLISTTEGQFSLTRPTEVPLTVLP